MNAALGKEPAPTHHSGLTEDQVMLRTLIAMCIPAAAAVLAMGANALFNILAAIFTAVFFHYLLQALELKNIEQLRESFYETPYSPLVAGMIVGLCVGELTPYYGTAFISALTMVVFKWGQERYFKRKIVNPAAGAKALVLLTITVMWFLPEPLTSGLLFYPDHLQYSLYTAEGFEAAMELGESVGFYGTENLSVFQSMILWKRHGWIGGASGILTLASGILLAFWIKLKWRIALAYLGGMALLSAALGLATGGDILLRIAFHVFTGSVIFLAFYMATEPQTTPVTKKGQYIFALFLAVLTMGLKMLGLFGSSFIALVLLNPFVHYLDQLGIKKPFGRGLRVFSPARDLEPSRPDTTSPVLTYDPSRCIVCSRCIKACDEIQEKGILGFGSRGQNIFTTAGLGELGFSECDGCGQCFELCPTGALSAKFPKTTVRRWEADKSVQTTCANCGTGCQLKAFSKNGRLTEIRSVDSSPNYGALCIKGRFGHTYIHSEDRLTRPLMRKYGQLAPVSWKEALDEISTRLKKIKADWGPDSIAALSSAKSTNEENYLFQKFMRCAVGTNNIDTSNRMCQASALTALSAAFGSGAMTNSIVEIREADCILVTGSNTTETHPVIARYIKEAVRKNGAELIVVDPRQIDLVRWASLWLRPKNGTDVAWINGLMKIILNEELHDPDFIQNRTEGFEELKSVLNNYTPAKASEITGIDQNDLIEAARLYGRADKASVIFATGITQHSTGTDNVLSLANLVMLTGNVGRPSTGLNPLQGKNNVQGASDMGALPDMLPGYQKVKEQDSRNKFAELWGHEPPANAGLNAIDMIQEAARGNLRAMLVMGENPMLSEPNQSQVERALEGLELLVVIDPFLTETAQMADLVLPAATFMEKEGTFTNTGRRVLKVNKVFDPPGKARPDWEIICALSARMGFPLKYRNPAAIMDEISILTPIYGGINYNRLKEGGIQWTCPSEDDPGTQFLHGDQFARGRGLFHAVEHTPSPEQTDENYPLLLSTGKILYHVRTGSMSRRSEALTAQVDEPYIEMNPEDAAIQQVSDGELIRLSTKRGQIEVKVRITDRVAEGSVFLPFHFSEAPANLLTGDIRDPRSGVPGFKMGACRIDKISFEEKILTD